MNSEQTIIAVIHCYCLRKSCKKTKDKAYFYHGIAGKAEQELQISVIYTVEIETHLSYSLSVQQTPSRPQTEPPKNPRKVTKKRLTNNQRKKQVYET